MSQKAKGAGFFSTGKSFQHQATSPQTQVECIAWLRYPIRRKDFRRGKRRSTYTSLQPVASVYLITLLSFYYFTCSFRHNPIIILCDTLIFHHTLKRAVTLVGWGHSGFGEVLARIRNSLMHALNGNTTQTTPPVIISLETSVQFDVPATHQNNLPVFKLSRNFLLEQRASSQTNIEETPNQSLPFLAPRPTYRTGHRSSRFSTSTHAKHWYHKKKFRVLKDSRPFRHPQNSIQTVKPTPPPRGTPGVASATNKECKPLSHPNSSSSLGRGTVRRESRRQYRRWRQLLRGNIGPQAPDNALARGGMSLKAVKRQCRQGTRMAKLFKQLVQRKTPSNKQTNLQPPLTTPPMLYGTKLRVAAQNVQSLAELLKHQSVLDILRSRCLDLLFLTETHSQSYYQFKSEGYFFISNGNKKDKYAGVSAVIAPSMLPFLKEINQHSARCIQVTFASSSGDIHFIGVYAPHNKHDADQVKRPFWQTLDNVLKQIPLPEPVYVLGDFNVRLQGRRKGEEHILGPHIYGLGKLHIRHEDGSNRQLYTSLLDQNDCVDALTFKQPNLYNHITYRDKNPPPKTWSSFVLDPLGWTQLWDRFHSLPQSEELNIQSAAMVRNFLTSDWPADPPLPPTVDPWRFQSLDRLFTRAKWLPSILKVSSNTTAGFPSDHYLLEACVRVKLKSPPPKKAPKPRYDYSAVGGSTRRDFNQAFKAAYGAAQTTPPVNRSADNAWQIWTDGAGSKGKCSASTPAGWGYVVVESEEIILEASGPVTTNAAFQFFLGASVGSNNTGEISALMEAALYLLSLSQPPSEVTFYYDSKWAASMAKGDSRPKRNKALVHSARAVFAALATKTRVQWKWVKGHTGIRFNERADALAGHGRDTGEWTGGRHALDQMATPHTILPPSLQTTPGTHSQKYVKFVQALRTAECNTLNKLKAYPRQPWITPQLAEDIERIKHKRIRNDPNHQAEYRALKNTARKLKRDWTRAKLEANPNTSHTAIWRHARQLKRGFRARKTRLKENSKPVPWSQTHEAFMRHLHNVQWGPSQVTEEEITLLADSPQINTPPQATPPSFTTEELSDVLGNLKRSKAPGLDDIRGDILMLLDDVGEALLLDLMNECFHSRTIPDSWKEALIVCVHKNKGSDSDPASHRPIALLNTMYKIYAALLQKRLANAHDHLIRETQYGFRAHRSTKEPIFIIRRYQDYSAKTGHPAHLLFLDWKQAFDKIDHRSLLTALKRFGIHQHYLDIIRDIYTDPKFCTQGYSADYARGQAHTGIRQGCPLSPYLFIIVMSVLFHDVDTRLMAHGVPCNNWSVGKPVYDLEYADDTALMALTLPQLQEFLRAVEVEASLYNLTLNKEKTELLVRTRTDPAIHFANGDPVPTTLESKYLGTLISWTTPPKIALKHRIDLANASFSKLHHVWCSKLPWRVKSRIFHSSILPALLYALDTCPLDKQHFRTLEGHYFRLLRRALKIKASYYSRISNFRVWKAAQRPVLPSQHILSQQFKLLIKAMTTPPSQPLHHVVFSPGYKDRIRFSKSKSRGHPAKYWFELVSKQALIYHNHYLDHSPQESSRDVKGLARLAQKDPDYGSSLMTAPTRQPDLFQLYSKTIGSAWQA